ncbi:uncharacterized protein LOC134675735 [Cydia fagiglandana]|uniref:uncharacterized protein LOC134675735 n=1 Tax=Cydia fagiglandana TaxID=1458189 RepID=UPI002FEE1D7E
MVETRSKTKADPTATESDRVQRERRNRSPRGARPGLATNNEGASALPGSSNIQTTGDISTSAAQPKPAAERPDARTSSLTLAQGDVKAPTESASSVHSKQSHTVRTHSTRSSATVRAQKLALEADLMRRQVERERELARQQADRDREQAEREFELARQQAVLARQQAEAERELARQQAVLARQQAEAERELARQQEDRERKLANLEFEAEQTELQARIAALEASDKSAKSRSSYFSDRNAERRTATWVSEQNANMTTATHGNMPGGAPIVTSSNARGPSLQPAATANSVSFNVPIVNQATLSKPTQAPLTYNYDTVAPRLPVSSEHSSSDPITKLTQAINSHSNRPKKPELITFSAAENLDRLNHAVRGQAYQSVASLMWTCGSPDDIVKALEQTYARPELLVAREVAELRNTPKLSSPQDLNGLANKLRSCPSTSRPHPRGLLKVVPVIVEGPDGAFETTAMLDDGSVSSLIDADVAKRIGARPTRSERLRIEGVCNMTAELDVSYVDFYVRGRDRPDRYLIEHARAVEPLGLRARYPDTINITDYDHLSGLANELSCDIAYPTVLIGAPDWYISISREVRCGKKNDPVASKTLLGWVLHGAHCLSSRPFEFINHVTEDLDTLIKCQYDIDALGITKKVPRQNSEDQRAVDILESSAHQLDDSHFEVSLPWKEELPKIIPDSYPQALSRFKALERQMSKDPAFAASFQQFIDDIISKNYAEECDSKTYHHRPAPNASCVNPDGSIRWYLPIFGVYHPQKKKLRAVHDAAATTKGVSLNSLLLQGPDLLSPLLDILFRFREGAVALNGDIKEMFPQIKIAARDRDAQRFLWRDKNGDLKEYRMSSMIFGAVSSPFIALYIKNKNAKTHEVDYAAACKAIIDDHYMDDYLGSHTNVADAAQLAADVVTVHKNCGFEMRAWTSNHPEALSLVPKELRSDATSDVYLPPSSDVGVLGVKWNPRQDLLGFRAVPQIPTSTLTKRILLSNVMKVYDPLGFLMPVVIWGRILIQRLWRAGVGWDTDLPEMYVSESKDWFAQLQIAANIKIPRWYMVRSDLSDVQLHVIADGGEQAYACVAYWRFTYSDDSVSTALIGSKARVCPLKPVSIPRLELQAALIASRFAQTIMQAHRFEPSATIFWTDSTTVLKWIRSDARAFKPFVAHRLGEILETTNPSDWRWIPTSLNVADDATKPKRIDFTATHRWFTGPQFLVEQSCTWPTERVTDEGETSSDPELKSNLMVLLLDTPLSNSLPDPTRFSSWLRLLRATARFLQGARLFRLKLSRPIDPNSKLYIDNTTSPHQLHASDMIEAEKMLVRQAQTESFPEELSNLRSSKPVPKNSRIKKLAPTLDGEGLMRQNTRISSAPGVNDEMKSPMILDGRHYISRLLILHEHIKAAHQFNELVLNELRQRYSILRARGTIRSVASACLKCKRWNTKPIQPQTGNLPPERLDHHKRPFTHVGLDYFGPILVTLYRRSEKRYIALYTCLTTRALHLEIVNSLTADSAIMSLRRFIARRGSPTTIFSDNGTNFVGSSRELRSLHDNSVVEYATNHKIDWRFIPPASPFMGGAWERLVRTVKAALRSCLTNQPLKEEVLSTLLLEAESIVNSRPLTYVPSSPDAPEALTPFHFILGSSSVVPWTTSLTDADLSRRCDWRRTLRLADQFWARWLREYLPTLRARGPNNNSLNLSEGDVVLIADPTLPRGLWPLGTVAKVYLGPDGAVRVADVHTRGGVLRRPARKLILMEAAPQPVATSG